MNEKPLLIANARIVNEGRTFEGDLLIRHGRIEKISSSINAQANDTVIDARGLHLLPGFIDDQVHFREPGMTHKADLATESAAAVAGGCTSFMDMPNTVPNAVTRELVGQKYRLAENRARANYAFYLGATNDNLEEIRAIQPGDCCGVKVFMGASTGNMLVNDPATLEGIFRDCPTLIATHCEDTPLILENEAKFRQRFGDDVPFTAHPLIRSEEVCFKSSSFAVDLARRHRTRLHVLHLSTAKELQLFNAATVVGDERITAEACVHMLYLDDSTYATRGAFVKCNPSIKTAADRVALVEGLKSGRIAVIGTDHAPHTLEEKGQKYFKAPSGLPYIQHAMLILFELVHDGLLPLELVVQKTSHDVARLFGVRDRGFIREGCWADLVLVDLAKPTRVRREDVLSKCGWSPFEGTQFRSSIHTTVVNGCIAYADGRVQGQPLGRALEFQRH